MFRYFSFYRIFLSLILFLACLPIQAAERVQPFVLASQNDINFENTIKETKQKLEDGGFTVIGSYQPYDNAATITFTNDKLKSVSQKSIRGGYGAVMRVSVTRVENRTEVSFTNPVYWASAYRLNDDLKDIYVALKSTLGYLKDFGSGDKILTESDLRKYHYTIMMEYFDDPSELEDFSSHAQAVQAVEKNLAAGKGATEKVYQLALGKDKNGKEMTLFGVALKGKGEDDCSGDSYIMSRIDKSTPRHTAHLPYELLVYGDKVEALYARFRIAISWPHLPMMQSDTGATFMSIMCSPGAIEDALEEVADD